MKRRRFIRTTLTAAAATAAPAIWTRRAGARAPSDTIRLGIIGPGSRGKDLMTRFLRVPGVEFVSACDIYAPRLAQAREIAGTDLPGFDDYRRMLDSADAMDAVIVATPLGHHTAHMVDSIERGLHLYAEKSLALTGDGCNRVREAARLSERVFQIGHQYRYAGWYAEAVRRIRNGDIGRVTHVQAYWHRNYNWRRRVPEPGLERQINWRLYRELSGGLLAELGSHHIDATNWMFDALPTRAVGTGAITFYDDGRETFDNVQVLYDYPEGRRLFFSSIIGNRKTGFQLQVYGTTGTIVLTLEGGHIFYERATENSAVPADYLKDGRYTSPTLATRGDMPYEGEGVPLAVPEDLQGDPNQIAVEAFVRHVREGTRPFADIDVGWGSGYAVALGNQALRTGQTVDFPSES